MSRDSGADQPTQRTVAELLAEYGGSSQKSSRRRRRRAEDPTETAPQAIIDRVLSDSGQLRAVQPDAEPPQRRDRKAGQPPVAHPSTPQRVPAAQPPAAQPPAAQPPAPPQAAAQATSEAQAPPAPQPPAPQPPAPQPSAAPPPAPQAVAPEAPAADPTAEPAGGANYWAQRFSGGQGNANPAAQPEADAEATLQQPALRRPAPPQDGPPPAPAAPPKPTRPPEGVTEQLPRVQAEADPDGTAMLAYPAAPTHQPQQQEEYAEPEDPYDFDSYDEPEAEYVEDDYDPELPAGLDADHYRSDEPEEEEPVSAGREWGALAVQGVVGLVGGGLVWVGFRWLWGSNALAALAAALVVTGLLVLIAWKFLRTNDLQTILLAVLVGLFCTVSPAALLLFSQP